MLDLIQIDLAVKFQREPPVVLLIRIVQLVYALHAEVFLLVLAVEVVEAQELEMEE